MEIHFELLSGIVCSAEERQNGGNYVYIRTCGQSSQARKGMANIMKEVMAIVRQNKVNATKEALAEAGIPAFTCRKVLGRGKKHIDMSLLMDLVDSGEIPATPTGEYLSETSRLISKRVFTIIVEDQEVDQVIKTIMDTNSTGNPGDGKIFVLPISENYSVRSGEVTTEAY